MDFNTIIAVGVNGLLWFFFIYALYYINRHTISEIVEPSRRVVSKVVEPSKREVTNIIEIEGIGPIYAEKLKTIGIKTTIGLLEAGSTPQKREELAEKTGISPKLILEWVTLADLMRIKGVGEEYSDLLEEAGVDTVVELSKRNPKNLHAKLLDVNEEKKLVRRVPSLNAVKGWIAHAGADNMLDDLFLRYDENLKGGRRNPCSKVRRYFKAKKPRFWWRDRHGDWVAHTEAPCHGTPAEELQREHKKSIRAT